MNKFINTYFRKFEILCTFVILTKNGLNIPSMKRTLLLLALVMSSVFGYSQAPPAAPAVPGSFKGAQINLENKALLEWTLPTGTLTGYQILYNIKGSTNIDTVHTAILNHSLTSLTADTVYQFKIRAFNAWKTTAPRDTVFSAFSPSINVVISKALTAPTVAVEPTYTTFNQITLRILDNNRYATHFLLRFEGEGSVIEETITRRGAETVHTQGGLKAKTRYKITAKALRVVSPTLTHTGPVSGDKFETTKVAPPPAAINFKTLKDCPYDIAFEWDYNGSSEDIHYAIVQASMDGWTFENIGTLDGNARSFSWTAAEPTAVYHYRILSQNPSGETHSGTHVFMTKGYVAPENPVNLRALKDKKDTDYITIAWNNGAQDNQCKTNILANTIVEVLINGVRRHYADIPPYQTTLEITGLQPKSVVEVFLKSVSDKQKYASSYVSVKDTSYGPSDIPREFIAVAGKDNFNNQVMYLSWQDVRDESQYFIERSTNGAPFQAVAFFKQDITKFTDTRLEEGVEYSYRIKSSNPAGESGYETIGPFKIAYSTAPNAPYGLRAKKSGNAVQLTWVDDTIKEEKYYIEKSVDGANYSVLGNVDRDVDSYTDNFADAGKTYYYRVRAWNPLGYSNYTVPAKIELLPAGSGIVFDATVYPNPMTEGINIKAEGINATSAYRVKIYDQTNKLVVDKAIQFTADQSVHVPVPGLLPGAYHLQLSDGKDKVTKKIIKL